MNALLQTGSIGQACPAKRFERSGVPPPPGKRFLIPLSIFCCTFILSLFMAWGNEENLDIMDATATEDPSLLQSLSGHWEFQPWTRLDRIPDFDHARRVNVPGHNLPGG